MLAATSSTVVFGHSFGGLVTLETARRRAVVDELFAYEPGVPIRGRMTAGWLDDYQRRLESGDRRGAFACMVNGAGFAPAPLAVMPVWYVRLVLRIAIRGRKWATMDRLLEANLVEHRLQAALDAPSPARFSTITAPTVLLGGSESPDSLSGPLLHEIAAAIPLSEAAVLPGLGHLAPQDHPDRVAAAVLAHRALHADQTRPHSAAVPIGTMPVGTMPVGIAPRDRISPGGAPSSTPVVARMRSRISVVLISARRAPEPYSAFARAVNLANASSVRKALQPLLDTVRRGRARRPAGARRPVLRRLAGATPHPRRKG